MRALKYLIKKMCIILFLTIQILVFFTIWKHYEVNTYFNNIHKAWAIIGSYTIINVLLSKFFHAYEVGHKRTLDLLFGQFMTIFTTNLLIYFQLCMLQNYPYLYSIKVVGLITIVNFIIMIFEILLLRFIYQSMTPIKESILVTTSDESLEKDLGSNKLNKRLKITKIARIKIHDEELNELKNELEPYQVVIIDDIPPYMRNNILKYCYENNKKCFAKPKTSDILIRSAAFTQVGYNSMLMYEEIKIDFWQSLMKRIIDIVCSIVAIICLSPLFVIIGLLIKLTDGGPIFYNQNRYTKDKKIFKIYKFRSMYVQNTNKVQMTTKNDKRVTPIGKLLRISHFDELPQLLNILKGDMSIVGPRPEMLQLYDEYEKKYPEYRYRLKVKAGLTGYAQIYGKYNTTPQDKLKFDLIYICNYSVLLDIKLILLTFKVVFSKTTSEGIEEGKTNAFKERKSH